MEVNTGCFLPLQFKISHLRIIAKVVIIVVYPDQWFNSTPTGANLRFILRLDPEKLFFYPQNLSNLWNPPE